jgi:predicted phage terminase large subunit-like protein
MTTNERNDYSVCTTWLMVGADYYLIDVFRGRRPYPDLRRKVAALAERYAAQTILIENAGPGMSLLQDLRRDLPPGMPYPTGQKPAGSKRDRMEAQSARIEAGHVHVLKAAWLDTFLLEVLAFPRGRHDDQVDSVSQFLNWAARQRASDTQNYVIGFPYTGQNLVTNCSTLANEEEADAAAHQIIGIY